jgi:hypothetical protein
MKYENFSIANGTRLRVQLSTYNNAPTVATITPASATEGSDVYSTLLEQPFCNTFRIFLFD